MNSFNQTFSIKRFGLLIKREYILRQSFILTILSGLLVALLGITIILLLSDRNYRHWSNSEQTALFMVLFSVLGILFAGTAFPVFRNQKKTMDFLLIPNSSTEKYLFEVVFRIVLFLILFPILFWVSANISGHIVNWVTANHHDLSYDLLTPLNFLIKELDMVQGVYTILALIVFIISIPFVGASFFSKNPLFKTILFLAILIGTSVFYGWVLDQILDFTHSNPPETDISPETALNLLTGFLVLSTFVLHSVAFYRLKEKEA